MSINIGIIGAINQEIKIFKKIINYKQIKNIGRFQVYIGKFKKNNIFLIKSGIGKVSSSIASMLLVSLFKPNIIINRLITLFKKRMQLYSRNRKTYYGQMERIFLKNRIERIMQ